MPSSALASKPKPRSAPSPASRALAQLSGLIGHVVYHNDETGYSVLRIEVESGREPVTLVGKCIKPQPGERLQSSGAWKNDAKHGRQFVAETIETTQPTTLAGIEKYLGSGLIKSVGPVCAKKLVAAFGADVFTVIEETSVRLETIEGIGAERRRRIRDAWMAQRQMRELMVFLNSNGIGVGRAHRIQKIYGDDAIARITKNPYCLAADVDGIGFKIADGVARRLGVPNDAPFRIAAGVHHTLSEASTSGHTALPLASLCANAAEALDLEPGVVASVITERVRSGDLIAEDVAGSRLTYLPALFHAETRIARRVRALISTPPAWPPIDIEKAIEWTEKKFGRTLADAQREALRTVLRSRITVITGGPGVGKSTLLQSLLGIVRAKAVRTILAAPTGRAAKRMAEATGFEAKTLHRLLEVGRGRGGFQRNEENPIEGDLLVVDEASMVDVPLMASLLAAVPDSMHLVLVGDIDQLPSVGPGTVLRDFIQCGRIPVIRLTQVFRQAAESRIITNAHAINNGEMPQDGGDFLFLREEDPHRIAETISDLVCRRMPREFRFDPRRDVQVLAPMHKGPIGTLALNEALQDRLSGNGRETLQRFGRNYRVGDKVLQTKNNYDLDIFNGDIGFIEAMDFENEVARVRFDERLVEVEFSDFDELVHAYAISIHKSQGSEFPVVVIPVSTQHFIMLQRNLLYTAVTRGRKMVVLVGSNKACGMAVTRASSTERQGGLIERLRAL